MGKLKTRHLLLAVLGSGGTAWITSLALPDLGQIPHRFTSEAIWFALTCAWLPLLALTAYASTCRIVESVDGPARARGAPGLLQESLQRLFDSPVPFLGTAQELWLFALRDAAFRAHVLLGCTALALTTGLAAQNALQPLWMATRAESLTVLVAVSLAIATIAAGWFLFGRLPQRLAARRLAGRVTATGANVILGYGAAALAVDFGAFLLLVESSSGLSQGGLFDDRLSALAVVPVLTLAGLAGLVLPLLQAPRAFTKSPRTHWVFVAASGSQQRAATQQLLVVLARQLPPAPVVVVLPTSDSSVTEQMYLTLQLQRERELYVDSERQLDDWCKLQPKPEDWNGLPFRELHLPASLFCVAARRLVQPPDQALVLVDGDSALHAQYLDWSVAGVADAVSAFVVLPGRRDEHPAPPEPTPSAWAMPMSRSVLSFDDALAHYANLRLAATRRNSALSRWTRELRHWPSWLGVFGLRLLARLPLPWLRRLTALFGWIGVRAAQRRVAARNLELCFPELGETARARLLTDSLRESGATMAETVSAWFGSDAQIAKLACQIDGLEHLQNARAQGRGVLLIAARFSHMELCARLLSQRIRIGGMCWALFDPVLKQVVSAARQRYTDRMFTTREPLATLRYLRQGGTVWYMPDLDKGSQDSVFVPFFGQPAATITATHHLARLSGALVLPFFHRREADGSYRLRVEAPLTDFPSSDVEADTARVNAIIEAMVREAPAQYLWLYRRFRTRPAGAAYVYFDSFDELTDELRRRTSGL